MDNERQTLTIEGDGTESLTVSIEEGGTNLTVADEHSVILEVEEGVSTLSVDSSNDLNLTLSSLSSSDDIQAMLDYYKGDKGDKGDKGERGMSAFEEWKTLEGNEEKTFDDFLSEFSGSEFKFDTDMPVVSPLGGIKAGENLNGLSIKDILNKMLFPYVAPTYSAKLTYKPTGTLFEKGEKITLTSMTATVTKKSENITEIVFLDNSTVLKTLTNVDSGGTFTYNFDSGVIINSNITNNRFRVRITDAANKTYYANTSAISFCYPFYYGSIQPNATLNGDLIKSLTKKVEQKGNKTYSYTTNNECMVIAYPVSYGTISKILDQNSFDVTSSFNLSGVVVNCLDGTMQSYYVYMNNASTVSNFKITFNF